nr:MAG: ORF1 [TTV-like mini virus]
MVYYYRKRYYNPRRRRFWRRRFRTPFRRRFWRRRRYRYKVKRKFSSIRLKQWQPLYIRNLKIKGILPLFITTDERISNDYTMYTNSLAQHYVPGGGGFSIYRFTLKALYELFTKVQNKWTQSNEDWPFIRYTGCEFKFYKSEKADYIVNYHRCPPMLATLDTFHSTQPHIMTLNKKHKIIRCKQNNPYKRPYKRVKIKPPALLQNNWYFQKDFAPEPLVLLMTTSMSLDRYFLNSQSISTTMGFLSLNDNVFDFYNYKIPPTTGYIPKTQKYMWSLYSPQTEIQKTQIKELIYLGKSKEYDKGKPIKQLMTSTNFETAWTSYFSKTDNWGNIFEPDYLTQHHVVLFSEKSPNELKNIYKTDGAKWQKGENEIGPYIQETTHKLLVNCRYNPYADTGGNVTFIVPITNTEQVHLHVPDDEKYKSEGYPLWLTTWGFLDYERKRLGQNVDTDYQIVLKSPHITPSQTFYIPIDQGFTEGRSPYRPDGTQATVYDQLHWHPKVTMQMQSINAIAACGPGTIKLPKQTSAEAHCTYTFHFKLGSCAPPMQNIDNPEKQQTFANNMFQTNSLQNPEYPLQYYLYHFDERRKMLTKRAAKRIKKIIDSEKSLSPITGQSQLEIPLQQETETGDSSEEEAEKETLLLLLKQQRLKQAKYKQRLLQLIEQLQTIE